MQSPVNLDIWNRAIELAVRINALAARIPGDSAPGFANQSRRASSSIPANIAEGVGQISPTQCARFIALAIASAFELESHLVLIQRLHPALSDADATIDELQQIRRIMDSYRKYTLRQTRKTVQ